MVVLGGAAALVLQAKLGLAALCSLPVLQRLTLLGPQNTLLMALVAVRGMTPLTQYLPLVPSKVAQAVAVAVAQVAQTLRMTVATAVHGQG
jgi:hypothetical protein